jgi:hypothetical protein
VRCSTPSSLSKIFEALGGFVSGKTARPLQLSSKIFFQEFSELRKPRALFLTPAKRRLCEKTRPPNCVLKIKRFASSSHDCKVRHKIG